LGLLVAYLGVGAIGVALVTWLPGNAFGRFCLNLFALQLFSVIAIVPHELGHAWVARAVRIPVVRIVIGFGTTFHRGRMLGFEFDWKPVMLGGLTIVLPDMFPWMRARTFLMLLAGPLTNLAMAGVVWWFIRGPDVVSFRLFEPLNPGWLFVLANLFVVAENLLPHAIAYGTRTIPSDGLALLRLLTFREAFHDARAQGSATQLKRITQRLLAGVLIVIGVSVFAVGAFFGLFIDLVADPPPPAGARWTMFGVFGGLGAALTWSAWRAMRRPSTPASSSTEGLSGREAAIARHLAYLQEASPWPPRVSPPVVVQTLRSMVLSDKSREAEQYVDELLRDVPDNGLLLAHKVDLLLAADRTNEALGLLEKLLARPGLGSETRTILILNQAVALVKCGQDQTARERVEELLASPASTVEKLMVLDQLACLPIMNGLKRYTVEAERWIRRALEMQPANLTLRGTLGSLLVELERWDEAEPVLREVYETSENDVDRGICSFYLALVARHRGDLGSAVRLAKRARTIYPEPWLTGRIKDEFRF